ncbi:MULTISPECIES: hypothetical protein [unclassified Carboxylicivirga]|uniref:hypothetical protein n=1 Tax=Carboxylicivirga TaxID=1628153 RepID=UPI003D33E44A
MKHITRDDINDREWDGCVKEALNGAVFATTWYLDIVCDNWEALVSEDYNILLPLPIKQRIFMRQVYCPHLVPYLGIINRKPISPMEAMQVLQAIPYQHLSIILSPYNKLPGNASRTFSYGLLDLIRDAKQLKKSFAPELKKAIEDYEAKNIVVIRDLTPTSYLAAIQSKPARKATYFATLLRLISFSQRYKTSAVYAAYDRYNQLMAGAFILRSHDRLSLIHGFDNDENKRGLKAIVYHVIKRSAGNNLTLEFPCYTRAVGQYFTRNRHLCRRYKKGLPKWISPLFQ